MRRFQSKYSSYVVYAWLNPKTYALHHRTSQRAMYQIVASSIVFYPLINALYTLHAARNQSFGLGARRFISKNNARVNPATFRD
jgi:hypothetical protein